MATSTTPTPFPWPAPPVGMQTYADQEQRTVTYAARMLRWVVPKIVLQKFATIHPIPQNTADNATFRRPVPWGTAQSKIPIAEGVTPDSHRTNYEDIPVTLKQYADVAEYSDKTKAMAEDNITEMYAKLSAQNAAQTFEELSWDIITSGTTVIYNDAAHTSRAQVDGKLEVHRMRLAIRSLHAQGADYISEMLSPSVEISTEAVEPCFISYGHTDLESDVRDLPGFVHWSHYGTRRRLDPCELGSWESTRFMLSRHFAPFKGEGAAAGGTGMVSEGGANVDVYSLMVCGKDSFGITPLRGRSAIKTHIVPAGVASASNPIGNRGYYSWSAFWAAVILNQLWQQRVEVGASDLSTAP